MQCPVAEPRKNAKYGFCPITNKPIYAPFFDKTIDFALKNYDVLCSKNLDNCECLDRKEEMINIIKQRIADNINTAFEYEDIIEQLLG